MKIHFTLIRLSSISRILFASPHRLCWWIFFCSLCCVFFLLLQQAIDEDHKRKANSYRALGTGFFKCNKSNAHIRHDHRDTTNRGVRSIGDANKKNPTTRDEKIYEVKNWLSCLRRNLIPMQLVRGTCARDMLVRYVHAQVLGNLSHYHLTTAAALLLRWSGAALLKKSDYKRNDRVL